MLRDKEWDMLDSFDTNTPDIYINFFFPLVTITSFYNHIIAITIITSREIIFFFTIKPIEVLRLFFFIAKRIGRELGKRVIISYHSESPKESLPLAPLFPPVWGGQKSRNSIVCICSIPSCVFFTMSLSGGISVFLNLLLTAKIISDMECCCTHTLTHTHWHTHTSTH